MTDDEILDLQLSGNLYRWTIREFFRDCLIALMDEVDAFSGKRPICDSDWYCDFEETLVSKGVVHGSISRYDDGSVKEVFANTEEMTDVINRIIRHALKTT